MFIDVYHNERCKKCKEVFLQLLDKIYGNVKNEYDFEVGILPEDYKNTKYCDELKAIFKALQKHRGHSRFVRIKKLSKCDFYIPNPGFIVEFDESQHFTIPRKITLELYPQMLSLGYDKYRWISMCEEINSKDYDPIFRDEQRAWYDTLKDFLPTILGLNPTVRVYSKDYTWCSLNPNSHNDVIKFNNLLSL